MRLSPKELLTSILLVALALHIYLEARGLPDFGRSFQSPGAFPALMAAIIGGLGVWLGLQSLRPALPPGQPAAGDPIVDGVEEKALTFDRSELLNIVICTLLILGYILLLPILHFPAASIVFLALAMGYFRAGNPLSILLISVGTSLVIRALFGIVFQIGLP